LPASQGKQKFNNWTYKARTEYDLTPQNLLYASFSTGFSPGDVTVTTDVTGQPVVLVLKDQTLKAYEFGSKNRFLGNRLQVNGSLYYYDYSGFQTAGIDIDPGPNLAFATLVAPVKTLGGELELLYQATPNDRIGVNLAYTDAHYVDQTASFLAQISRKEVSGIAPFAANVSYSHRFDLSNGANLTVNAEARYLSDRDVGTITQQQASLGGTPLIRADAVVIGDLSATWNSPEGKYSLSAYVRNIGDERIVLNSQIDASSGAITGGSYSLSAPRTVGIVAAANF
jgi:iron complex outermembrane receptor protein